MLSRFRLNADFEGVMWLQTTQFQNIQWYKGVGCVAEAVALAGAGKNSTLIVTRVISKDRLVTAAVAGSSPFNQRINYDRSFIGAALVADLLTLRAKN